jgi:hypothetical protein
MPSEDVFGKTTVLRNNPGMFRDCYYEKDGEEIFLVLRQIKLPNTDESGIKIKQFRLDETELKILKEFLAL